MYKFWLSRRERDELDDLREAAIQKERADRLTEAIGAALLRTKGDNRFWSAWHDYSTDGTVEKEPTVRELRKFMDEQMSDAEKARAAEYIMRGY